MLELSSLIRLNRFAADSFNHRLLDALRTALLDGRLRPGDRLPPTRELADELSVSRNSVLFADVGAERR